MEKMFYDWNAKKKEIHLRADAPFYGARELWWCSLGVNVGFEQDGSGKKYDRPVLILRGFSKETCLVIPLTTSVQQHPLRPSIEIVEGKDAHALLSQMRIIDTKRLIRKKIGFLDKGMFETMRKAAKDLL